MIGPNKSPTPTGISHQSFHAVTPFVAQVSAYEARDVATSRGIAPSELLIR